MNIVNSVDDPTVTLACQLVGEHYKDEAFLRIVGGRRCYWYTLDSPQRVAAKIASLELSFKVVPYETKNAHSRVLAYASRRKMTIYVNTRNLNCSLEFRVDSIIHEVLHLLGYKHLTNMYWWFNRRTVPYKVGELLGDYMVDNFPEEFESFTDSDSSGSTTELDSD